MARYDYTFAWAINWVLPVDRLQSSSNKLMGIEVELIIATADIVLALLLAVSLPTREETT
jgi:hypothetical protein